MEAACHRQHAPPLGRAPAPRPEGPGRRTRPAHDAPARGTPLVVVSSREMAREVLRTHDANFATRPRLLAGETLMYGCSDILFSPSGTYWRKLRPLCAAEILSANRVRSFRHIREQEVRSHVENIHAAGPSTPVDVTMTFFNLTIKKRSTSSPAHPSGTSIETSKSSYRR
uniref:Uncharacterized protein n=1 Tax=Aegilops tauschii subsp. strangulata TaxID=200361 RepID=A0A453I9T6_AEGTS